MDTRESSWVLGFCSIIGSVMIQKPQLDFETKGFRCLPGVIYDIGSKERQNSCFKVTKRILIANIFRPLKDHVHSNKINENVDIKRYPKYQNEADRQLVNTEKKIIKPTEARLESFSRFLVLTVSETI